MPHRRIPSAVVATLALLAPTLQAAGQELRFTAGQLREDFVVLERSIRGVHPDLAHSVSENEFDAALRALQSQLTQPMTRDEAWRHFARLNPVLADGHLFVTFNDWRGEVATHRRAGGLLFPFEVQLAPDGLLIRSLLGGGPTDLAGSRVLTIDGVPAADVCHQLLLRAHGDTPAFREALISRRFWFYYWKLYGAPATFDVVIAGADARRAPGVRRFAGSPAQPVLLADETDFGQQFRFELRSGRAAVLTLGTFDWHDKDEFLRFTRDAFAKIRDAGIETLVLDVRANGGGDDAFWREGILPYVATQRWRWGSTYRKRVLEQYRDEGETVGEVVSGTLDQWIEPGRDDPLRFKGRTVVLVGPSTYSSGILFANVMQDFGFGTLAGTGGAARADQSGSVQKFALPNTGFAVYVPRFVLARPAGASCRLCSNALVQPDIAIAEIPLNARAAIDEVLRRIR